MNKLDGASLDLLRLLARGSCQVVNQKGAQALMQRGLATMIGGNTLLVTDKGRGFIEGVDHVLRSM